MADFSLVPSVEVKTYEDFKALSQNADALKTFYCRHTGYYQLAVCLQGFSFTYILPRTVPIQADEQDFIDNIQPAGIVVCDDD